MRASTGPAIGQLIRHHGGWDGNPTAFPVCLPANRKQEGGTNWAIEERKTIIAQKGRQSAGGDLFLNEGDICKLRERSHWRS